MDRLRKRRWRPAAGVDPARDGYGEEPFIPAMERLHSDARQSDRTAGAVLSDLARRALTSAPAKSSCGESAASSLSKIVAIDGGHYACFTDLEQFLKAMRHHVLPLVK
jgi:hypothetical protein